MVCKLLFSYWILLIFYLEIIYEYLITWSENAFFGYFFVLFKHVLLPAFYGN